jgi:type II secretion system protein J
MTRGDRGFTLVELLVTISILGMVTLAIGDALIGFTTNTDATIQRLGESHDAQITAAYFAQDVSSIGIRSAKAPYPLLQSVDTNRSSDALPCGSGGIPVVRLGWDDPTGVSTSAQVRVAYVIRKVSGERQLHRLVCDGDSERPTSDTVMAHYLADRPPTVTCTDPTSCEGTATDVPESVTMVLYLEASPDAGPVYSVTLTGQRRQTS